MSNPNGSFNVGSSTLYRYVLEGILGAVLVVACALFIRSRFVRTNPTMPIRVGAYAYDSSTPEKPRLFDVFLDLRKDHPLHSEWGDILPLSVWGIDPGPDTAAESLRQTYDEPAKPSTISTIINMPANESFTRPSEDADDASALPYCEIGIAEVVVRYWQEEASDGYDSSK